MNIKLDAYGKRKSSTYFALLAFAEPDVFVIWHLWSFGWIERNGLLLDNSRWRPIKVRQSPPGSVE
jgi:hypothetical protein